MRNGLVSALCLGVVALLTLPAFADIKAFNAAVARSDYKAATAEAASTWPQLDKSRKDILLIAQEFGYAAYIANDFAAMKSYAEFINGHASLASADPYVKALAAISLRLADLRLTPSAETRAQLNGALVERSALDGFDNITYFALDSALAYDLDNAKWKDAQATAAMGVKLAQSGGGLYQTTRRKLELLSGVADYVVTKDPAVYARLETLRSVVLSDMDQAPDDDVAKLLKPLYFDIATWETSLSAHIRARGKSVPDIAAALRTDSTERLRRIFSINDRCRIKVEFRTTPQFPMSAFYGGFVGAVLIEVDIGADGKASNPNVLSAVPSRYFGPAVLKMVPDMRFKPNNWTGDDCALERKAHRIEFEFLLGEGSDTRAGSRIPK